MLSAIGGLAGIGLGFLASYAITELVEWPANVSPGAVGLSFGFSAVIGIFFGLFPARRAARRDPIEALRYE